MSYNEQEWRDRGWMADAIREAQTAQKGGQRPFGCVIVNAANELLGFGGGSEREFDPAHHSEIEAIQLACVQLPGPRYLTGCTLYSTHEPCAMCCGAINHAKISRVVFGSYRRNLPGMFRPYKQSLGQRLGDTSHPPEIVGGVRNEECCKLFWDETKHA